MCQVVLSRRLASHLAIGDKISFPISVEQSVGAEILITKNYARSAGRSLYQAPIEYVGQPRVDKRGQHFVTAEVRQGRSRISATGYAMDAELRAAIRS